MNRTLALFISLFALNATNAQTDRWQQKADYTMNVSLDSSNHQFTGSQTLVYWNNSPDVLDKVFYHLYFNAFQPGSSMDVRSRTIEDPDGRVGDRISKLTPPEFGFLHVKNMKQDGKPLEVFENETILEVKLAKPIQPGGKATFEMEFDGQVPIQIRRSGRDNAEGIDYSMSQWYPKMCEYDCRGWHANPYIAREFYGVWGNFEVSISMDSRFIIAATGKLVNEKEVDQIRSQLILENNLGSKTATWKWKAENVHDFTWAADTDYVVNEVQVKNGPLLKFYYQPDPAYAQSWKDAQPLLAKAFEYIENRFGKYPYDTYSFVQGGDGGMEYPMLTLVTGNRKTPSLVGVSVHEAMHSWYQGVLGFDESHYYWMDEGFTSFATQEVMDHLFRSGIPSNHQSAYNGYFDLANGGKEEALTTHADHFNTNNAYGEAAYSKGEVYLCQLGYIMGEEVRDRALKNFYDEWKFRHPNATDFLREMEKESGLELDWYNEYFVQTTHTIDYAITQMVGTGSDTYVMLERKGKMPMPVDLIVTMKDGSKLTYYIPLDLMRGEKIFDSTENAIVMEDWQWVAPNYVVVLQKPISEIASIEIDPSHFMADIDRSNNFVEVGEDMMMYFKP